ncbi:MAG: hypothetical protein JW963_08960 [Anaerolineales bacterium]|nr:hypothetical protein [Anaerolineales bacterium]
MNDSILTLFEGLTPSQADEFRRQIVPTLKQLRNQIISGVNTMSTKSEQKPKPQQQAQREQFLGECVK